MSHVLRVGQPDQIAYFRAYNTDGSANTSLTASTTGLTLSVFRVGASSVSIASLSNKAADNTAHADGAIRNVGGNLYTIDLPDAACATQVPSICVRGSYTGGVIEGLEHPIVAYDPAQVAVGANTTTPPTAAANASQVRTELATELGRIDTTVSSRLAAASYTAPPSASSNATAVRSELTVELNRIDVAVSTRLASGSYVIPDNTSIAAIKAKTDNLPVDPADSSDIAAAFVTVNSKLDVIDDYIDSEVAAIRLVTDRLDGMLVLDGSVYQFTENALELGASTSTVYVYPMSIEQEPRNTHAKITVYTGETGSQYFFAYDSTGAALTLTGKTLEFRVADTQSKQVLYTAKTSDGTLTITLGNKVTFTRSTKFTRFANTDVTYSLRDMNAGGEVLLDGPIELKWAP